jgi:3-oxoacyl-[acyl-carrier protein] reductase
MRAMDLGIHDRVALVTGASKGIGRGIAEGLIAEGVRVAIASRSADRVAGEIGARGYAFDSNDLDAVPGLIAAVQNDLGPIDIYIANTGGPPSGSDPLAFTREQWEAAHRTLVLAPMTFLEHLLPGMRERGFGRVVAIGSIAVREPADNLQLSNAHRPGLVDAFKVLARQVAADGVTLNSVLPGRIDTDRIVELMGSRDTAEAFARENVPAQRMGTVEEFAAVAVFLCSARASYVTGETVVVDGGMTRSVF